MILCAMNGQFEVSALGAVIFLLLALLLFGLFHALRYLLKVLPMTKARRSALLRVLPTAELLAGLLYVLSAIPLVFKDHPDYSPIVLSVMLGGVVWVSWFAIRDFMAGVFLKAGKVCRTGDHVRLDGIEGRVKSMGFRVVEIVSASGDEIVVPYSRISRQSISRLPTVDGLARHSFRIDVPPGLPPLQAKAMVWTAALNDHWASLKRDPQVDIASNGSLDITVYALTPDHGPLIEQSVRGQLEAKEVD
jgi:small-conductance mechanosensitive channel